MPLRALRKGPLGLLCHCLSLNERDDADILSSLRATAVSWPEVVRTAGYHLVTPSLAGALKRRNIFEHLDRGLQEYLGAVWQLNQMRNDTLRTQLVCIARELNGIGIEPLLIKGAVALLPEQYPGSCDRILGDLDIVVPEDGLAEARNLLFRMGYSEGPDAMPVLKTVEDSGMHHIPPMLHHSLPVSVELHRRMLWSQMHDKRLREGMRLKSVVLPEGMKVLVPDPAARLVHSFVHSQISHQLGGRRLINLRHLLEFARVAQHHHQDMRCDDLHLCIQPEERPRLAEYWALAEAWLGAPFPEDLQRSRFEWPEAWITERVMTSARWRDFSEACSMVANLPRRFVGLGRRVWADPAYLPIRIRRLWAETFP